MAETKRPTVPAAEVILDRYFPVLDHGFIALKDYMGADTVIEETARLSYQGGTRSVNQTRGLLRYLRRLMHTSPSEMMEIRIHVSMPIFVARQWVRHRTASLNEVSGRYSLLPMLFYTPKHENFGTQSKSNKQGREGMTDKDIYLDAVARWNESRQNNQDLYEDLAADGVARELARIDLPLSTYTQWMWKVDMHNLLHFLTLRCDEHAQWEIRQYANALAGFVKRLAPLTYEAWIDYQFRSARFSRLEMEVIQETILGDKTGCAAKANSSEIYTVENLTPRLGSKREAQEFLAKISKKYDRPGFDLSESDGRDPSFFENKLAAATPKLDAAPAGAPE